MRMSCGLSGGGQSVRDACVAQYIVEVALSEKFAVFGVSDVLEIFYFSDYSCVFKQI